MKVLLTGATGFIGSNIAKGLLDKGFDVFATYRDRSSFDKCVQFKDKINWINTDIVTWKDNILNISPDQFIHTAWEGIEAGSRNNWNLQVRNFWYSKELFDLLKECGVKKVIALGSQAEYGAQDFSVDEDTVPKPNDAYGAIKLLTANYLQSLFDNTTTAWYWIRVFSIFGEGESSNWLIPTTILKLLKKEPVRLTKCEQKYNYLYVKDFLYQLLTIVDSEENRSGIYNICNLESISLKDLLMLIADQIGVSQKLLLFGDTPYRPGQNMLIAGDNSKFNKCFAIKNEVLYGLTKGLVKTIEYHKKRLL